MRGGKNLEAGSRIYTALRNIKATTTRQKKKKILVKIKRKQQLHFSKNARAYDNSLLNIRVASLALTDAK